MSTLIASPPVTDPRADSGARMRVVAWGAGIATFTLLYAPQGVLTQIAVDFGLASSNASWVVAAATFGLAASVIPWALLSDRIGRHRALQIALLLAAALAVAGPLLPGFAGLIVGRVLLGAALGGIPALAITYLHEAAAPQRSAALAAAYVAATTTGGLIGRLAVTPLAEAFGWRMSLLVVGSVAAVLCGSLALLLPRTPIRREPLARSIRLLARQSRSTTAWPLYAIGALAIGVLVAVYNSVVFRLEAAPYELAPGVVSLVFLCYLGGSLASRLSSAASRAMGPRWTFAVAGAAIAAGIAVTLLGALWFVVAGIALLTMGVSLAHATASGTVPRVAGEGRQHAVALYSVVYYVGASVFGVLGASAFAIGGWPALAIGVGAVAVCITALGSLAARN
ncbi:Predicted arabinose efflux permease, MFS family [Agromyces sp. CF514]|uniref:MFS transporter n=1 Tax=Agromyces sp. CF514 TaxID=1881031 RepID=UPI0008E024C2|nr:MFS transporter [Agromyces sp. CF514]SFR78298.1 Predicted arabinose efflux permease, MFS family [Agromyces sp. CF514]